jgi:hypothetical protein
MMKCLFGHKWRRNDSVSDKLHLDAEECERCGNRRVDGPITDEANWDAGFKWQEFKL